MSGSEVAMWNHRDTSRRGYKRNHQGEREAAAPNGYFVLRAHNSISSKTTVANLITLAS